MKKRRYLLLPCLGLMLLLFCRPGQELPGWGKMDHLSASWQRKLKGEILQVARACPEEKGDRDALEDALIREGWMVEDSDKIYPSYLANPAALIRFWEEASAGKNTDGGFLRVSEDGGFSLTRFIHSKGETICALISVGWEGDIMQIRRQEVLPVYDMVLADWGTFYYRLFPEDPHYIDYMQVRLNPPDRERYDLCRKYILPVGYQMVNLFLVDWAEGDWENLAFSDVFEYLYEMETGENGFSWTDYVDPENHNRAIVPTALFEDMLLSYFSISREELRSRAGWTENGYPWRTFFGDDLTSRSYPICEPEIAEVQENEDGTFTLWVRVGSPEKKTDCLFAHAVTIRPLADGSFQYVSNRVTEVGPWGLPYHQARFQLDY